MSPSIGSAVSGEELDSRFSASEGYRLPWQGGRNDGGMARSDAAHAVVSSVNFSFVAFGSLTGAKSFSGYK